MSDLGTSFIVFGFSNPGGAANSSGNTERFSVEVFEALKITCKILASQVWDLQLQVLRKDSKSNELGARRFTARRIL